MNKLSLEESLKILAPFQDNDDAPSTPVSSKKSPRRTKHRVKTPTRSPVRIPTLSPAKLSPREKIVPIQNTSDGLYEDEQIELKSTTKAEKKEVIPHTPTRLTIETPRTPTRKFEDLPEIDDNFSLKDKLREYRYSLIKYLLDDDKKTIEYATCFDPNGQIIFIRLDKKINTSVEEHKKVNMKKIKKFPEMGSYQNSILNKITTDISGVVFYDFNCYVFANKNNQNDYEYDCYLLNDSELEDMSSLSQAYVIVSLTDLEEEAQYMLQSSKRNYQIIQQQQLATNKKNYSHLFTGINELNSAIKTFDSVNNDYMNGLVEDWALLGSFSTNYYNKYSKGKLTEEEKSNFDQVSVNMFVRFQNFNDHVFTISDLDDIIQDIKKLTNKINNRSKAIEQKHNKISGKIVNMDEVENLI